MPRIICVKRKARERNASYDEVFTDEARKSYLYEFGVDKDNYLL